MPSLSHEERAYLVSFITDLAQKKGNPFLMSILGDSIVNEETFINLRNAYGSLPGLVKDLAPDVLVETEGKDVNKVFVASLPRSSGSDADVIVFDGYPVYIDPNDAQVEAQIDEMHHFAFMGWWNNTYRQLKRLTGYSGNDPHVWTCIIAKQFNQVFTKDELLYREYVPGEHNVCIFKTGLRTIMGKTIVAILVPNPGAKQPWALSEYTYAGNELGTYGMWLLDVLPESGDKNTVMAELRKRAILNLEMLNSVYPEIEPTLRRLADGYILDDNAMTKVREYLSKCADFKRRAKFLPEDSLDYTSKKIGEMFHEIGTNSALTQLRKLNSAISDLLEPIENVFRNILAHNTADNSHAIAKCRNYLAGTSAAVLTGSDPSQYQADYEGWVSLLGQLVRALWEGEVPQSNRLTTEFSLAPIMINMLHDFLMKGSEEESQAVLQKLTKVEENLSFFENAINEQQRLEQEALEQQKMADAMEAFSPEDEEDVFEFDDSFKDLFEEDAANEEADAAPAAWLPLDENGPELSDIDITSMVSMFIETENRKNMPVAQEAAPVGDGGEPASVEPVQQQEDTLDEEPVSAPAVNGDEAGETGGEEQPGTGQPQEEEAPVAVFDQAVVEQCRSGGIDAEMQLLRFGEWKYTDTPVSYTGMSAEEIATQMLTSDAARSEAGLMLCLNHSIRQRKLQLSSWLLQMLEPGVHKMLYDIVIKVQYLLANEATDNKPSQLSHISEQIRNIWNELSQRENGMSRKATAVIMAQLHHMITRYFQIDTVQELLAAFSECKWLPQGKAERLLKRMQGHLKDPNADPEFLNNHRDMTARLIAVNNLENRNSTLERLQAVAERLWERFANCGARYGNARNVIRSFVTEKSPRTFAMLNSLKQRKVLNGAFAFEDEDEMMAYANALQETALGIKDANDIVGSPRNAILLYMTELNDAFCQLRDLSTERPEAGEQMHGWYKSIIVDLNDWRELAVSHLKGFPADDEMIAYLTALNGCNPLQLVWDNGGQNAKLYYACDNQNPWPFFREDELICGLMELSGHLSDLTTLEMSRSTAAGDKAKTLSAVERLLSSCTELNIQLHEMKRFSSIDLEVCKDLLDILDHTYGWLERIRQQLDGGNAASITLPLVRHEMEIWYVDRRIEAIFSVVADSVKASIEQHAGSGSEDEYAALMQEIDEAVARRDINFITERFADEVSSIAYLGARETPASMFFDLSVLRALTTTIAIENWAREKVNPLFVEKYARLSKLEVGDAEIKTIGRAINISNDYLADKESLTEQRLERLQDLFKVLGFGTPRLEKQDDRLNLRVDIPDRSICPIPQLGIGIGMRDPSREKGWCVNYQVRIMRDISEVNTLISSAQSGLNDTITILLCPFAITASERMGMLRSVREMTSSRNLFLLDTCFLRFAMCLNETERLSAFYSCTASLMRLNPYTVTTELKWEGTFFGRGDEIDRVTSINGCHVLYGGRRLGKTSIMREAEFRWLSVGNDHIALYINLQGTNPDMLWYRVARELSSSIPALSNYRNENPSEEAANADARMITRNISDHLRSQNRHLLLLLDECDELVYRDAIRNNNQEQNRETGRMNELVSLMNESDGHCKVVLAGLDRVTRFIRNLNAYNMFLPENSSSYQRFSASICVRPMLGIDMQNAYDLIDIPFRVMGYRMDRDSILYILRVCCFRPNLIQNYCRALLEAVRVRDAVRFEENSLYLYIPYELVKGIQEGRSVVTDYHSQQAEQSIRIPLNVGETAVYAPIAYAVALLSLRNSIKGMFTGFKPQEILAVLDSYNPNFSKGVPQSNAYISTILEELVSMGILRSVNNADSTCFALFSHYMMKMLGDAATIEAQLIESLETHIARSRNSSEEIARRELFLERFIAEDSFVFPLTSAQLETLNLALKQSGYAVVVGSDMLRLSDMNAMFPRIRLGNAACEVQNFHAEQTDGDGLQQLVECHDRYCTEQEKHIVLIVDGSWTRSMVDWAREREEHESVSVVFLANPDMCWQQPEMLLEIPEKNKILLSRIARSFRIGWFNWVNVKQKYRFGEDSTDLRKWCERVGEITGDWPEMVMRFWSLMQSRPYASFSELENEFRDVIFGQDQNEIAEQLGLNHVDKQIWDMLRLVHNDEIAEGGGDSLSDILELADDRDLMLRTVGYMQMMGLVDISGDIGQPETCSIRLDPFADRIMKGGDER